MIHCATNTTHAAANTTHGVCATLLPYSLGLKISLRGVPNEQKSWSKMTLNGSKHILRACLFISFVDSDPSMDKSTFLNPSLIPLAIVINFLKLLAFVTFGNQLQKILKRILPSCFWNVIFISDI